jgi:hypothetical protein
MSNPKAAEIWLVRFPFSDLSTTKLRPALVLAVHREEQIILGIFSKIPPGEWWETWILVREGHPNFSQTGLKNEVSHDTHYHCWPVHRSRAIYPRSYPCPCYRIRPDKPHTDYLLRANRKQQ